MQENLINQRFFNIVYELYVYTSYKFNIVFLVAFVDINNWENMYKVRFGPFLT
jgi:hypothetical protein